MPPRTIFVEAFVGAGTLRDAWCADAVATTEPADLVFLDPDNGLEVASVGRGRTTARKYVYYSELPPYTDRGQSLVVYHHLGQRHHAAEVEIEERLDHLRRVNKTEPFAVRFRGGTARAYFVIPAASTRARLLEQTRRFLASGWAARGLFEDCVYE